MKKEKPLTKKELQHQIELLEEALDDAEYMYLDLQNLQEEYKKRYGKVYEY